MSKSKPKRKATRAVPVYGYRVVAQNGDVVILEPETMPTVRFLFAAYMEISAICELAEAACGNRAHGKRPMRVPSATEVLARIMRAVDACVQSDARRRG